MFLVLVLLFFVGYDGVCIVMYAAVIHVVGGRVGGVADVVGGVGVCVVGVVVGGVGVCCVVYVDVG